MARDGTNRGGRRVRAGSKPAPLNEKLAAGKPALRLGLPVADLDLFDFAGDDVGDGAVLSGNAMPAPADHPCQTRNLIRPLTRNLIRETSYHPHLIRSQIRCTRLLIRKVCQIRG